MYLSLHLIYQNLNFKEKELLFSISMLTQQDYEVQEIFNYLDIDEKNYVEYFDILHSLYKKDWLIKKEKRYSLPVDKRNNLYNIEEPSIDYCKKLLNIASFKFSNLSKLSELKKYEEIAENLVTNLNAPSKQLASFSNNLAVYFDLINNYNKSLKYTSKAIAIQQQLDDLNRDLCFYYNNQAIAYRKLGDYKKSLKASRRSINIAEKDEQIDGKLLANTYNILSATYDKLKSYSRAIEYNLKAIDFGEVAYKGNHIKLAGYYYDTAVSFYNSTNFRKAKHYIDYAFDLYRKLLPKEDPTLNEIYRDKKIFNAVYSFNLQIKKILRIGWKVMAAIAVIIILYLVL